MALTEPAVPPPDFRDIYETWFDAVWRLLRRLGVRDAELLDAAQEVFVVVHRRLGEYDPELPLGPWIAGITWRIASHERRRARHRREELTDGEALRLLPREGGDPERAAIDAQRARRVLAALEALDLDRRIVFILHDLDGTSAPDIARALEIPLNTVYSRLRIARERFRAALDRLRTEREDV